MPEPLLPVRDDDAGRYYYRRPLTMRELAPAVGIAVGAGMVAFYLARMMFQRTPLAPEERPRSQQLTVRSPGRSRP